MSPYEYEPFAYSNYVRYLEVGRSTAESPFTFHIDQFVVGWRIHYTALSYTWGDSTPTRSIAIGADEFQVGQNLFDFLNAYNTQPWGASLPRCLWIDQICINQADVVERDRQVSMMNLIYKMADRVLVWLGCDAEIIEAARQLRDNNAVDGWAITTILRHPYFTRVWIVQEIALAQDIDVLCGGVKLKLSDLQAAATRLEGRPGWAVSAAALAIIQDHGLLRILGPRVINNRALGRRYGSLTLEYCISQYCQNGCTDPRDKVYGLLGMTSERWRVSVSYEKSVVEVYLDAMAALCEELFDRADPKCFYEVTLDRREGRDLYHQTLLKLARAMGIPQHQNRGLDPFLRHVMEIYTNTPLRNVEYTYRGLLPNVAVPSASAANEDLRGERGANAYTPRQTVPYSEGGFRSFARRNPKTGVWSTSVQEVSVIRRNPLLRDVISGMGLQLAQATAQHNTQRNGSTDLNSDQWWFEHNGKRHYYDCPVSDEHIEGVE